MIDSFFNNNLFKSISNFVNFCKEILYYNKKELKFLNNMPINNKVVKEKYYQNKFVFNSITGNRTSSK